MVQSISNFATSEGKKTIVVLSNSSSKGLGTPEVKNASVLVSAFTGNKITGVEDVTSP